MDHDTALFPAVQSVVADLTDQIAGDPAVPIFVTGPSASGRSVLLRALRDELVQRHRLVVLLAPPMREVDTAGAVLLDAAAALIGPEPPRESHLRTITRLFHPGLTDRGSALADWQLLMTGGGWLERKQFVSDLVDARKDERLILLFDEPTQWPIRTEGGHYFANQVEQAVRVIDESLSTSRRRVTVSAMTGRPHQRFSLGYPRDVSWLRRPSEWGTLAGDASAVADIVEEGDVRLSPLELRLWVGIGALTGDRSALSTEIRRPAGLTLDDSTRVLRTTKAFLTALESTESHSVIEAWQGMSVVRRAGSRRLFEQLVDEPRLSPLHRDLVFNCLLSAGDTDQALHSALRRTVSLHPGSTTSALHRRASAAFAALRASAPSVQEMVARHFEALHHRARSGDAATMGTADQLGAEQLIVLAYELSRNKRDYHHAADAYRAVLEANPDVDYAHHYYAYNLDVLGRSPELVEQHYRRALALDDTRPLWWMRLISFLIAVGRGQEARECWRESQRFVLPPDPDFGSIYEDLHYPVLHLLLDRGLLDFAGEVVKDVPAEQFDRSTSLGTQLDGLRDRLLGLRAGKQVRVAPASVAASDRWWRTGPRALPPTTTSGEPLVSWVACRVESVIDEEIALSCLEFYRDHEAWTPQAFEPDSGQPLSFVADVKINELDEWLRAVDSGDGQVGLLEEGVLLEIGHYLTKDATESLAGAETRESGLTMAARVDTTTRSVPASPPSGRYLAHLQSL